MDNVAIRATGLGKRFQLGDGEPYALLHDTLLSWGAALLGKKRRRDHSSEELWALREVSFSIDHGEVVGIIGRNGAGKSSLLKVLSRITEPTTGMAEINGRVGSLLEVGTGFHPELSGRENVFLNGAILGMSRQEIRAKFDEIVAFSGVERFLDTPVKRYSSGMYTRLAFAVAAHLEPEILMVDEVLAVGDAAFQRKCLGKMGEVAKQGRTVLFVSHNMRAVTRLCSRVLLLKGGTLVEDGAPETVVASYLRDGGEALSGSFSQPNAPALPLCLLAAELVTPDTEDLQSLPRHRPLRFKLTYQVNQPVQAVHLYAKLLTADEMVVLGSGDADLDPNRFEMRHPGIYTCWFEVPERILNEGDYLFSLSLGIPYQVNHQENNGIIRFGILDREQRDSTIHRRRAGVIWLDLPWHYEEDTPWGAP